MLNGILFDKVISLIKPRSEWHSHLVRYVWTKHLIAIADCLFRTTNESGILLVKATIADDSREKAKRKKIMF